MIVLTKNICVDYFEVEGNKSGRPQHFIVDEHFFFLCFFDMYSKGIVAFLNKLSWSSCFRLSVLVPAVWFGTKLRLFKSYR